MLHLLEGPVLGHITDERRRASGGKQTHDLSVAWHVLNRCATTAVLQPLCYNRCATTAGQVINSLIKRATFDKSKIRPMVSFSVSSLVGSRIRSLQSNENEAGVGFKVSAFQRNFVELKRHFFQ